VRTAAPEKETRKALEADPLYEAERLRIIYQLITNSPSEGGAGITPKSGEWEGVESIFALHDHEANKKWIKKWSTVYFLKIEDLDDIRDRLGEKIAFYFAFTQSYFAFLTFPAAAGAGAWALLGHFSPFYAIISALWCIVFTEYWKHQEVDLAVRWGVRGVSRIESKRREFKHEKEITDPVTGEQVLIFPAEKRLQRQLLQIPFAIGAAIVLGALIATCFGIEVFISEIYDGPLKWLLVGCLLIYHRIELTTVGFLTDWNLDHRHAHLDQYFHHLRNSVDPLRELRNPSSLRQSHDAEDLCHQLHNVLPSHFPYSLRLRSIWANHRTIPRYFQPHRSSIRRE